VVDYWGGHDCFHTDIEKMTYLFPRAYEGVALPEYGRGAPVLKKKYFDLSIARDLVTIEVGGSTLWAIRAGSFNSWIDVRLNEQTDDPFRFELGMFVRGAPFSRLYVSNDAQAGEWIEIVYMAESPEFIGKLEIANPASQFNEVSVTKSANFTTVADVAVNAATVQVLAGNAATRTAFISNLLSNPNAVRVGDANTGAARGMELDIGGTLAVSTYDDIYVYSAGNSSIGVAYTGD